jgi:trans-aconitate methyltransferase
VSRAEELARTAQGWDAAASGYEAYFVPRFAPWVDAAVQALIAEPLPGGPLLVPCCGPFPEAGALVEQFPDREIVGLDLSAGMVARARERVARWPQVRVVEGDAATLDDRWTGQCAAVLSVFGLQALPEPDAALRSWLGALRPGGRLAVVFWPDVTEDDGPFALIDQVLLPHRQPDDDTAWETRLPAAGLFERDELIAFPITHPSAAAYFDAFAYAGPMRALANERGKAFVDQLRAEYVRGAPTGEWRHNPRGRLVVAGR